MPRSSSRSAPMPATNTTPASAVSCFSYLASVQTLRISQLPDLNYGTDVLAREQFLAGDGPITAGALTALGHHAILGSNHVADDNPGRDVQRWLRDWGVTPAAGPRPPGRTRVNIVACDTAGNRTWFSGLRNIDAEL
jgi:sugar/nucleoside kinase (ribokinase family)